MTEGKKVNIALGKNYKCNCYLFYVNVNCLLSFLAVMGKKHIYQISAAYHESETVLICSNKDPTSAMAAVTTVTEKWSLW